MIMILKITQGIFHLLAISSASVTGFIWANGYPANQVLALLSIGVTVLTISMLLKYKIKKHEQ